VIPQVVIVGRPNVGKSSLLNLLSGRLVSIVDPTAGVTRDRVSTTFQLPPTTRGVEGKWIELTDTGGYGIEDSQNLTRQVEQQIALGIAQAHLVLFVIDCHMGMAPLDREVARLLRQTRGKSETPKILLIANKADGETHEANAYEALQLGFGEPIFVSATTGRNKHELYEAIEANINWDDFKDSDHAPETGMLLAIVGKRNAGKSTLVNALAGQERVIVSEIEGTTRDSVDVRFTIKGKTFTAIDTAGVRKGKSLEGDIEYYSYHRALRSIRRADVVMLMLDATVAVSQVDKQLGNEILAHFKPTIIVVNKWDLAEKESNQEEFLEYLDKELKGFDFAPIAFISAVKDEGLGELVSTALSLFEQASKRVPTGELNRVMEVLMAEKTPSSKTGKHPKIYYVTQLQVQPPTIGLFVNNPEMFDGTYERFLMNRFREMLPFGEVPIKLLIRGKERERGDKTANPEMKPYEKAAAIAAKEAAEAAGEQTGRSGKSGGPPGAGGAKSGKTPANRGKLMGRGVGQRRPKNLTDPKGKPGKGENEK
jgi:GTP-binding protein